MTRLRVVSIVVQIEAFADDGETLSPLSIQPLRIPVAEWRRFVDEGFDAAIRDLQVRIEEAD